MINRLQLKIFLEKYKEYERIGDEFMNKIPRQIRDGYFDNPYVESLSKQVDLILRTWLNSKSLIEEIEWFLYDWDVDKGLNEITTGQGKMFVIVTVDDFLDYLEYQGYLTNDFV